MKKFTLTLLLAFLSICSYGQLTLEGFESPWTGTPQAPPLGWVVYNEVGNITWKQTTLTTTPPYTGSYAAYLDRENVTPGAPIPSNWLITPQFNSPTNGLLHFYSRLTIAGDQGGIYKIMIAPVTDTSVPVTSLPWVELIPTMSELTLNPLQQQYVEKTINIPAPYAGQQVRIAFIMQGDQKDRWIIDDVEVVSKCDPPSTLTATNVNLTSADLNWSSPAGITSWEIELVPDADVPTGTGITYSGTLPYHKTGLTADTAYKYYVRSNCSDGGKSAWIGPFYFVTPKIGDKCSDPIIIPNTQLPYTNTNNTANFGDYYDGVPGTGCGTTAAYLNGNDVIYSYTPNFSGTININLSNTLASAGIFVYTDCANIGLNCVGGALATTTASAIIPSFAVTAGTTYYLVVSSPTTTVPYTLTLQQVNCAAPTGLTASGHTSTSVNLSWAAGTATSWQLMVQPAGSAFPTIAGQNVTQNTNLMITSTTAGTPLTQATNYEYYVRANCNDGTFSIWTGPFAFSTTQVPVSLTYTENFDGPVAHGWSINNGTQTNKWYVGSNTNNSPTNSLYITNNDGQGNYYTLNSTSTVHAYRDIQIPAGTTNMSVSFDLKAGGEVNDYVRAWLIPVSSVPSPNTQITVANSGGVQIAGNFNLAPVWTTKNEIINVSAIAGTTRRLVFEWRNNAVSGLQPGAAIDNVKVAVVTCLPPTNLTAPNATTNSATISWTAPTGTPPVGYEYYYSQSITPPTPTTVESGSVTGTTTTITPLNQSETYYAWVRSSCGAGGKSFWTGPVTILIPQETTNLNYSQNFDAATHGFSFVNGTQNNKWIVGSAVSNSPSKSMYISNDNINYSYDTESTAIVQAYKDVVIPTTAKEINISFDYKVAGEINDYFRVWMVPGTYAPIAGTQIVAAAVGAGDRVMLGANHLNAPDWTTESFDLPVIPYQGLTRRLVFEWRNNSGGGVQPPAAIDNINITVLNCPKPTTLAVTNVTTTGVTLDWTEIGSATNWEVAYMPAATAAAPTTPGIAVSADSQYTPPAGTFEIGTQYAFYVRSNCGGTDGMSKWTGPYLFALKPLNDECAQAIIVSTNPDKICTNFVTGNVTGATASAEPTTCAGTKDDDVWFEFVATNTSHFITFSNVTGNNTDIWHVLYSGSDCATMTQLYCSNPQYSLAQNLVIGQTYKIRVYTFTSAPNQNTSFKLCITTPPPPPQNDNCANAVALTVNPDLLCGVTTSGTIESATASGAATTCAGVADDDVWFTFVATNVTHKIDLVNIEGASLNIVLYSGSCSSLTQLACNATNQTALWANNLTIGQTYTVRVYSFTSIAGQTTTFGVCIGTPVPAPANDNCSTAAVVPVNPTLECAEIGHGNLISATPSPEANTCGNVNDDDDIWFEFTATSTSHIIEFKNFVGQGFGIVPNYANIYHVLYSGTACGSLTQVYCNGNNNSLASGLTIGQVYKIRVYSETATPNQQCAFDVCITTPPATVVNDNCSTAITIPVNQDSYCNVHASGSVHGATASPLANTCTGTTDDDIWFEFTATNAYHLIYLDNITGTSTGLNHSVYSGDCNSLNLIYCNPGVASAYSNFIIGNTYKIRVYTSVTGNQSTSFDICVRVPNVPINVIDNTYTPEQLVSEVLFNTPCATISNVSSTSGLTYGDVPSIGYFDAPDSAFPFTYGVILTTGNVNEAEGPYTSNGGNNPLTWLGDDDLEEIILEDNIFNDNGTHNASVLEFDFVPLINKFEFEFLFASAEYGGFQCAFGDAFAFILTDESGNSQNLAVLPNTTIPVSVLNIKDEQFNDNCGSANIDYFGQYNVIQPLASAINYNGQTEAMIASATVIPGQTYHIKLVIADYSDASFASAVFLGGGTFNIGTLDLGTDLLVADGTALCDTESKIIDTQLTADQYDFTWFKDGVAIADATEPTYEVTEAGIYGVEAAYQDVDCSFEGTVKIEFYPLVNTLTGDPSDMTACDASGFHTFDITSNIDALLALPSDPENFTTTVHLSEADAQTGDNPVDPATYSAYTNVTEDLQTLWTRTVYNVTMCIGIKSFDLIVQDLTPQYTIDSDFSICEGTSDTIDIVITDTDPNPVTYTWTKDGAPLPDTTPSITVTEAGAYTVVLDRTGCTATSTVNVTVTPIPVADDPADVISCNSYELPALSPNNGYFSTIDGTPIAVGTVIVETIDVIVRAESATTPNCTSSENIFTITITNNPVIVTPGNQTACDTYVLPALTVGNYFTATGGTGTALNAGDEITTTQTIYVYAENTLASNCNSEASFVVTINTSPVADAPADVSTCESYVLPALTAGNTYWTGSNQTGEQLPEGYIVEETIEIYVFAQTGTTPICTDENLFNVTINPIPEFSLGGPYVSCAASNITINVTGASFNEADATYEWTLNGVPVDGGNSIIASGFGIYTLTVTVNNCSHTESVEVTQDTTPILLNITDSCESGKYMLSVTDVNGSFDTDTATYAWTGPNDFVSAKREFEALAEGEYFVTVTTPDGCIGEDSFIVTNISCEIQRGISPNNDGLNDVFDLSELSIKQLNIFSRYGQEVYSKNNYKNEWGGKTNNGKELPTGTYFYTIEFMSGEAKTGWIYINRQD